MFRHLIGLVILVSFSHMAAAQEGGFYAELRGGVVFLNDSDLDTGFDDEISFDTGFLIAGAGGYAHSSGFRGELELGYRENNNDELDLEGIGKFDAKDDTSAFTTMVNGYYDIDLGVPKLRPYIGGGIGLAVIDTKVRAGGVKLVDDDDTVFAYQALAGVAYHFTPNIAASLGYAFLATADPEFKDEAGDKFDAEYASHNIMLGLRYSF